MKRWLRKVLGVEKQRSQREVRRARRRQPPWARLLLEPLEDRTLPTVVFDPVYGTEAPKQDNGAALSSPPVYLIFWGSWWNSHPDAVKAVKQASANVVLSPYFSGLTQYHSDGRAVPDFRPAFDSSNPRSGRFGGDDIDNVVQNQIDNGTLPESDATPNPGAYVVVTPPDIVSNNSQAGGFNTTGFDTDVGFLSVDRDAIPEIWAGTQSYPGAPGNIWMDQYTEVLSHELAEAMSDPGFGGYEVNPGPQWPLNTANSGQIGDYEGNAYGFRETSGTLVQPYWSRQDQAWIAPDGSPQTAIHLKATYSGWAGSLYWIGGGNSGNTFDLTVNAPGGSVVALDTVTLAGRPGVQVQVNGETAFLDAQYNALNSITINTGGHDYIYITVNNTENGVPITLNGGGDEFVQVNRTGTGLINFHLGSGSSQVSLNGNGGDIGANLQSVPAIASTGVYSLDVEDSGAAGFSGQTVTLTDSSVSGLGPQTFTFDPSRLTKLTVSEAGFRNFTIRSTPGINILGNTVSTSVFGGQGSPTVDVVNNSGDLTFDHALAAGPLNVKVEQNAGSLTLGGSKGADTYEVLDNAGHIAIQADAGANVYNVHWDSPDRAGDGVTEVTGPGTLSVFDQNNQDDGSTVYTIDGTSVDRVGTDIVPPSGTRPHEDKILYHGITSLVLNPSQDPEIVESLNVNGTGPGVSTTINAGGGRNTVSAQVTVGGPGTGALGGGVTVNGNGQTQLTINEQGALYVDPLAHVFGTQTLGTLQPTVYIHTVVGTPLVSTVTYHQLAVLSLHAGLTYPTTVSVQGTAAGTSTGVQAGPAALGVVVGNGGSLAGIAGPLTLGDEPGVAAGFVLDDSKDGAAHTGTQAVALQSDSFFPGAAVLRNLSLGPIYLSPILASLTLNGGIGTNAFNVDHIPPRAMLLLKTGSGSNAVNVAPTSQVLGALAGGLTVQGGGNTTLTLDDRQSPAGGTYALGSTSAAGFRYSGVSKVTVYGSSSYHNTFGINETGTDLGTGGVPMVLNAGSAADEVDLGTGSGLLRYIGSVTVNGGAGTTLLLDDHNNHNVSDHAAAEFNEDPITSKPAYTIGATTIQRDDPITTVDPSDPHGGKISYTAHMTVTFSQVANLTIQGGDTGDSFAVNGTPANLALTIQPGGGQNTVDVAKATMNLADLRSDVTVQGGSSGSTMVNIYNTNGASPGDDSYTITDGKTVFGDPITVNYSNVQGISLFGGAHGTYNVQSVPAGATYTINPGAGPNVFNLLPGLHGLTVNNAQSGTCTIDDSGDPNPVTYTITPTTVQINNQPPIPYPAAASLILKGGSGLDAYNVQGISPATPVTVVTGRNTNFVNVTPTSHNLNDLARGLTVQGGGQTLLTVYDQNNQNGATHLPAKTVAYGITSSTITYSTGAFPISYSGLSGITLYGADGRFSTTYQVSSTAAGTQVSLYGGSHNQFGNGFLITGDANALGPLQAPVFVDGAGRGSVEVRDTGGKAGRSYTLAYDPFGFDTLTATGIAPVTFHGLTGVTVNAGPGNDSLTLSEPPGAQITPATFNGGGGSNTLFGPAAVNLWTLTGVNAGTVGPLTFAATQNLVGGSLDDTFLVRPGTGATGKVDGGAGFNTLDVSAVKYSQVNLQTATATGVGGFANIQELLGSGYGTLVGPDTPTRWNVLGSNEGLVVGSGLYGFVGFDNLQGGAGADTFQLGNGFLSGTLDGGGGTNGLDYSAATGNVVVDLPLRTASRVGGSVTHVRNVTGGQGTSLLVGDGTGNTLSAGTGRSLLIAGPGAGTLIGGGADDILVGGSTAYDRNLSALSALMAEWARTDQSYAQRVSHLLNGGGLNGSTVLNRSTFTANTGGNTLTGAAGLDLFYGSQARDGNDWTPGIGEVFVDPSQVHASTQINVGALSLPVAVNGSLLSPSSSQWLSLPAGTYTVQSTYNPVTVSFGVNDAGIVSYDPSLEGVLSGAGTAALTINGRTITVDARPLSAPYVQLDGPAVLATNTAVTTFTGLPGTYTLLDLIGGATGQASFILSASGTVSYSPALEGVLTGAGTAALVVHGATVTVDATALSVPQLRLADHFDPGTATPFACHFLPGQYSLTDIDAYNDPVAFTVGSDAKVGYDPALQGILTGAGTSTLTVHGVTITVDATAISLPLLTFDTVLETAIDKPIRLTVLPGADAFRDADGYNDPVAFSVGRDGTVQYDPALEGLVTGAGTSTLTIHGVTITVDATALSLKEVAFDGDDYVPTDKPIRLTVLPGADGILDPSGTNAGLAFRVGADGTVAYAPALEGVLTGAGTGALTVHGVTVTIDARALSAPSVDVDNAISPATSQPFTFTGLPGPAFLLDPEDGSALVYFTLNVDGTVSYDAALEGVLSGAGTNTLVVHGTRITIDATALAGSVAQVAANNDAYGPTAAPFSVVMLPGMNYVVPINDTRPLLWFTVAADGTIDYDPSLDGVLSGRGTRTLVILALN